MKSKSYLRCSASKCIRNVVKVSLCVILYGTFRLYDQFLTERDLENIQKACAGTEDTRRGAFKNELDIEDDISSATKTAERVSRHSGTVLVSVVNDAFLPFAYSWLCNTKYMDIHKSVLIITTDTVSKQRLNTDWPDVSVVKLNLNIPPGNQEYSRAGYLQIMIRRTEILMELLRYDLEILLLEFDYMWFSNPIPQLQKMKGVDFLVNPVTAKKIIFNGGFVYMFPTERSKALWRKLTDMMHDLEKQLEKKSTYYAVSKDENDQVYFTSLIQQRYANVTTRYLPLDTYADGRWYDKSMATRDTKSTVVISNNFIVAQNRIGILLPVVSCLFNSKLVWVNYRRQNVPLPAVTNLYGDEADKFFYYLDREWVSLTESICIPSCPEPFKETRETRCVITNTSEAFSSLQDLVDKWMADTETCNISCEDDGIRVCTGVRNCKRKIKKFSPILIIRLYEHCLHNRISTSEVMASEAVKIEDRSYKLAGITMHRELHYCAVILYMHTFYWYDGLRGRLQDIPNDLENWFPCHAVYCQQR